MKQNACAIGTHALDKLQSQLFLSKSAAVRQAVMVTSLLFFVKLFTFSTSSS